jgi:hypothetical protein
MWNSKSSNINRFDGGGRLLTIKKYKRQTSSAKDKTTDTVTTQVTFGEHL